MTDPLDQDLPPKPEPSPNLSAPTAPKRPHWVLRVTRHGLKIIAEIVAVVILGLGLGSAYIAYQFSHGPVSFEFLNGAIASGVQTRLPPGFSVSITSAEADRILNGFSLAVTDLVVRDDKDKVVLATPRASIGFDGLSLLVGKLLPRSLDLSGLVLSLTIRPDSTVSISTSDPQQSEPPEVQKPAAVNTEPVIPQSPLSVAPFMDAVAHEAGIMGLLEHAKLSNGVLRIDDQRRNRVQIYRDLSLNFDRLAPELMQMAMTARAESGLWSLNASLAGGIKGKRRLTVAAKDLAVSELLGFAHTGNMGVRTEMPLSFLVFLDVDAANNLTGLTGNITGGKAKLSFDRPNALPLLFDRVSGDFALNADTRRIDVPRLEFQSGKTNWVFTGGVAVPNSIEDGWAFDMESRGAVQTGDVNRKTPIRIDSFAMRGKVMSGFVGASIDFFDVKGPDLTLSGSAQMGHVANRDGWAMTLACDKSDILSLLAFWPTFLTSDVRSYLARTVEGGTVDRFRYKADLDAEAFHSAMLDGPIPDNALSLELAFHNGVMRVDPGLPRMTKLKGQVDVTGTQVGLAIQSGALTLDSGGELPLSSGSFRVSDTRLIPAIADIAFDFSGDADPFFKMLSYDMIRSVSTPPVDSGSAKGQVAMAVKIRMPLKDNLQNDDIALDVKGDFTDLTVDNILGREKIENANAKISVKTSGMQISGAGKLSGAPIQFDLKQKRGAKTSDLAILLTTDDAFRAKRGLKTTGSVTGTLVSRANLINVGSPTPSGTVEIDLQKATITNLIPGWVRPSGKPGKINFNIAMTEKGEFLLDNLVIDDSSISMKANAVIGSDGGLQTLAIPNLRIAQGDRVQVNVDRVNAVYKVKIVGDALDGKGLLKSALTSSTMAGLDLDVDLRVASFSGFNAEVARNFEYRGLIRDGVTKELRLQTKLGNAPIMGQNARGENGQNILVIESADAGAFMRFADIYKRMNAGAMTLELGTSGDLLPGKLTVKNFAILDEAAIKQLTAQTNAKKAIVTDPRNVSFSRMQANFLIGGGRLYIRDATMSGPALGGTLEGTIDYTKNTLDMRGTFVPVFAVNNLFNKVPVIGSLLGGANEGIIGINYRVTGSTNSPQIMFNPLSVVTPGFLRRLFDFKGPVAPPESGTPILPPNTPMPEADIPSPPASIPQQIQ